MLADPSESLNASLKMSTFKTRGLAGGADSLEKGGDPAFGNPLELGQAPTGGIYWNWGMHRLGESTGIGVGTDPAEGLALLDDPRRRNEDRDPDKATRVSSSEDSNDSVSESDGTLAGSFWACLLLGWEADRFPPAVP